LIVFQTEDLIMAYERDPDRPYQSDFPNDETQRRMRLDNDLQVDPELAEGPASGGKIAIFAVAIALVLGVVFYGFNNSSMHPSNGPATAQNSTTTSSPAAPDGVRSVTPGPNSGPGVTTGAAPSNPQRPSSGMPTGQEVNRSGNPPMSNDNSPTR